MARGWALTLSAALACAGLLADSGVAVWEGAAASDPGSQSVRAESRRLREESGADAACEALLAAGRDQLVPEEAHGCLADCAAHAASWGWYQRRLVALGALVVMGVCFVSWLYKRSFYGLAFAVLAVFLMDYVDDFTGVFFAGHGTMCLKSLACVVFGRSPPWLGYALGCALAAWSAALAFRAPLDREALLRGYISNLPSEDAKAAPAAVLGVFPATQASADLFYLHKKATLCFGDLVVDAGAILSYLRRGQPIYASLSIGCIWCSEKMAKRDRAYYKTLMPPAHFDTVSGLRGPQSDFIFYFRESLSVGIPSPAFLFRAAREFELEAAWTSYIAFSALFSSDCANWFPLGQWLAQVMLGCVSALDFGEFYELAMAETPLRHSHGRDDAGNALVSIAQAIPRGHYAARQQWCTSRRMDLIRVYRLCEYLSKGVVTTAFIHHITPAGLYVVGLLIALAFVPLRLRSGIRDGTRNEIVRDALIWPIAFLLMHNYGMSLPSGDDYFTSAIANTVPPTITTAFLSILWMLFLAHGAVVGWPAAMISSVGGTSAGVWGGVLCEEALLQNAAAGRRDPEHLRGRGEAAGPCDAGISPMEAQVVVRVLMLLLGLAAHLGLVALSVRLAALHRQWRGEDEAQVERVRHLPEAQRILHEPGGGGGLLPCDAGGKEPVKCGGGVGPGCRRVSEATTECSYVAGLADPCESDGESERLDSPLLCF